MKSCKVCLQSYPLSKFPFDIKTAKVKGCLCCECSAASECLQRTLKTAWKAQYKQRYKAFKEKKEQWRQLVLSLTKDPSTRQHRAVKINTEDLVEEAYSGKKRRRQKAREPLTFEGFHAWYQQPANGGYSFEQNERRWADLVADSKSRRDKKGVVGGIGGQLRIWCEIGERELSDSESGQIRRAQKRHCSKKEMEAGLAEDFLAKPKDVSDQIFMSHSVGSDGIMVANEDAASTLAMNVDDCLGMSHISWSAPSSSAGTLDTMASLASTTASTNTASTMAASLSGAPAKAGESGTAMPTSEKAKALP